MARQIAEHLRFQLPYAIELQANYIYYAGRSRSSTTSAIVAEPASFSFRSQGSPTRLSISVGAYSRRCIRCAEAMFWTTTR
jgi:hypothetical protein